MPDTSSVVISVKIQLPGKAKAERLTQDISDRVLGLKFHESDHRADKCTLKLDNRDLSIIDDAVITKGSFLEVSWGAVGNMAQPRVCVVTKIKGGLELTVEATAKSILMHRQKRSRSWAGVKRSDVVAKIATEWGLDAAHQDIADTGKIYDLITQKGMTDAAFIAFLARREGYQFFVDENGLHFLPRQLGAPAKFTLWYFADPNQGDLLEYPEIENEVLVRPGSASVKGLDPRTRKPFTSTGNNDTTKRSGLAPQVEVEEVDPETQQTRRVMKPAPPQTEDGSHGATGPANAQKVADAKYAQATRLNWKLKAKAWGNARITKKIVIAVLNIGKVLSGNFYVREIEHDVEKGYRMVMHIVTDGPRWHGAAASKAKVNQSKPPTDSSGKPMTQVQDIDPVTKQPTGTSHWVAQ